MKTSFIRGIFAVAALLISSAHAALNFTVSPATVANESLGTVTYTVTGITPGNRVHFERFLDINSNGLIDEDDPLIRRFGVTDGSAAAVAGVRNRNIPGDDDGAQNGAIRVDLPFPGVDRVTGRMPGAFLIRATEAQAAGEVVRAFQVTQPVLPQRITGTVRDASNGQPIPFAFIIQIPEDGPPITSVVANASGVYTIFTPPGDFIVLATQPAIGFVASGNDGFVTVAANQTLERDLLLTPATATVTGRLTDSVGGFGLQSVLVVAERETPDNFYIAIGLTDDSGDFQLGVTPGDWELNADEGSLQNLGYVPGSATFFQAANSPTVQNVTAIRATALIHGTVQTAAGQPLGDVGLWAERAGNYEEETQSRTIDAQGRYFLAVLPGQHEVSLEISDLLPRGLRPTTQQITVTDNQAALLNFSVGTASSIFRGRVVDSTGAPVVGANFHGHWNDSDDITSGDFTGADGRFEFAAWGGEWRLHVGENGFLERDIHRAIQDNQTVDLGDYVVIRTDRQITGTVRNNNGQAISFVGVNARGTVNGVEYYVYTETDAAGAFSLGVVNGTWTIGLDCWDLQQRQYQCPAEVSRSVQNNTPIADFTVSGLQSDAYLRGRATDEGNNPIAGLQIGAYGNGPGRQTTTGANGEFEIGVTAGTWNLQVSGQPPAGKIAPSILYEVQPGVNIENINFRLLNTTATITGTVRNSQGQPISGAGVFADATINGINYLAHRQTDAQGFYSLPVVNGDWRMWMDCWSLEQQGYECPQLNNIVVQGASVTRDITVFSPAAWLRGRVVDERGNGLQFIGLSAGIAPNYRYSNSDQNGNFAIGVPAGAVELKLTWHPAGNYIGPVMTFNVQQGVDINNIVFRLLDMDRIATGFLRDQQAQGVNGVGFYATATIDNQTYTTTGDYFTGFNGSFSFPAADATWRLYFDCEELTRRGFICPNDPSFVVGPDAQPFVVTLSPIGGANLSNAVYIGGASPTLRFRVTGAPGTYDVYQSDTLQQGSWSNTGVSATINPGETFREVTLPATATRRFYITQRRN